VNRTRNCVGDIWHYLPEPFGKYTFMGKIGHFNIRLMRRVAYRLEGIYPNEVYTFRGEPVNNLDDNLVFSDTWYLHATHLSRTSLATDSAFGRRKKVFSNGIAMSKPELPEVLFQDKPALIPSVTARRPLSYEVESRVVDIVRAFKPNE